jgi:hypothetical protein
MLWALGVVVMGLCISTESYVATAWMGGILLGCGVFKMLNDDIENHPAGGPSPYEVYHQLVGVLIIEFIYIIIVNILLP